MEAFTVMIKWSKGGGEEIAVLVINLICFLNLDPKYDATLLFFQFVPQAPICPMAKGVVSSF